MPVDPSLLKAARETYDLELHAQNGLNEQALEAAISSALETHERAVHERIADIAESYAEEMTGGEAEFYKLALHWFAHKLRKDLSPQTEPYKPADDDIVELRVIGPVVVWDDSSWSVIDDQTGREYEFARHPKRMPRVRALSRAEQMEDSSGREEG